MTQKPSTWGYLLTDVKAFGDDSMPQVSLKDLLDPQRYDTSEQTSLGLICSKELILAQCGALQLEQMPQDFGVRSVFSWQVRSAKEVVPVNNLRTQTL